MVWVDWLVIGIVSVSTFASLIRGFVKEAISLATWIAAFILARSLQPNMDLLLEPYIVSPLLRAVAAFGVLFVGVLVIGGIIASLIGKLIAITGLSFFDRAMGSVFGFARGVIIVVVMIAMVNVTPMSQQDAWKNSWLIQEFSKIERWTALMLGGYFDLPASPAKT